MTEDTLVLAILDGRVVQVVGVVSPAVGIPHLDGAALLEVPDEPGVRVVPSDRIVRVGRDG